MRRLATCSVVAAVSALAGAGLGYAVADGSAVAATPATANAAASHSGALHAGRAGHRGALRRLAGRIVVGRITVRGPGGSYRTFEIQRGTVLGDSAGTMTVRSPTGSTVRYQLTARTHYRMRGQPGVTAGPPPRGERVLVIARVTDGANEAWRVVEGLPARGSAGRRSGTAGTSGMAA